MAAPALALAVTFGCAARPPAETAPPSAPPPPDFSALYERMERNRSEYEAGIELIVAGDEVLGETRIAAAVNGLNHDVTECAAKPGCDLGRFLRTFDHLLNRQSIELKKQGYRIDTLETSIEEDVDREPGTSPFVTAMPELGESVSLLRGTELREIITLNGPIEAALDDWLTWMRPLLMDAFHNYQFLRDDIAPVYEDAGLPEALLFAMIATETGGKVHSFSRAGAAGLLQFMRYTGRRYGLGMDGEFDLRLDPVAATKANVAYLNEQFEELNDSLEKALAAYNGGENRVKNLHRRYRGASLWDKRFYYALPQETREYVPRILAAAWLFLHPEEYNLEFPRYDTSRTVLAVRQPTSLGELTICLGQEENPDGWFRTLRNLNPRLNPGDRLESGDEILVPELLVTAYEERCLEGEIVARARALYEANYPDEPEMIPYTVRRGDTLGKIASRHRCVSVGELAELNRIRPPRYTIRVGQQIKIPGCG